MNKGANMEHIVEKKRCADCVHIKKYMPYGGISETYHCNHMDCFKTCKTWDPFEGEVSISSRIDNMDYMEMNKVGQCKRFVCKQGV